MKKTVFYIIMALSVGSLSELIAKKLITGRGISGGFAKDVIRIVVFAILAFSIVRYIESIRRESVKHYKDENGIED